MSDDKQTDAPSEVIAGWQGYFRGEVSRSADDQYAEGQIREKHTLRADEPPWLADEAAGDDSYPAPVDYLMFGLVSCQVEVMDQALKNAGVEDYDIEAQAEIDEMEQGEVADSMYDHTAARVRHIDIDLTVTVPPEQETAARQCLDVYDSGCVVGQSFRTGIEYTATKDITIAD